MNCEQQINIADDVETEEDSSPPSQGYPEPLGVWPTTCVPSVCVPTESITGRGLRISFHRRSARHHHRQNSLTRANRNSFKQLACPTYSSPDTKTPDWRLGGYHLSEYFGRWTLLRFGWKKTWNPTCSCSGGGRTSSSLCFLRMDQVSFVQRNCSRYMLRLRCNQDVVWTVGIFEVNREDVWKWCERTRPST